MQVVVVSESGSVSTEMANVLTEALGKDAWSASVPERAVRTANAGKTRGSLFFVLIESDTADSQTRTAQLLKSIRAAGSRSALLTVADLSSSQLHELLRSGADNFLPMPASAEELQRLAVDLVDAVNRPREERREGRIFAFQHTTGGVGATTLAANLAWELASAKAPKLSVCLIDLDLQFGAVATYLDLERRNAAFELLNAPSRIDADSFVYATVAVNERLHVFTGGPDILPPEMIDAGVIRSVLDAARSRFDIVILDLPPLLSDWMEIVLRHCERCFLVSDATVRSAQANVRFMSALRAETMPVEKVGFLINRAPGMLKLAERSKLKGMIRSCDLGVIHEFPEGGPQVAECGEFGSPLAVKARRNPLRKAIQKFAVRIVRETPATESSEE